MGVMVAFRASLAVLSAHRLIALLTAGVRSLFWLPPAPPRLSGEAVVARVVSVTKSENTTECPSREFEDIEELVDAMLTVVFARR